MRCLVSEVSGNKDTIFSPGVQINRSSLDYDDYHVNSRHALRPRLISLTLTSLKLFAAVNQLNSKPN